jgi:transcriptional regulator with XRE-family HTH domain
MRPSGRMSSRKKSLEPARDRIARHMRARRDVLGLSQEKLAEMADLHRTYIGSVERAERNVSIENVERIAQVMGLDIVDLLSPGRTRAS